MSDEVNWAFCLFGLLVFTMGLTTYAALIIREGLRDSSSLFITFLGLALAPYNLWMALT